MTDKLLTTFEVAELLQMHPEHIRRMAKARQISCIRIGKAIRYRQSDVDEFLSQNSLTRVVKPDRKRSK